MKIRDKIGNALLWGKGRDGYYSDKRTAVVAGRGWNRHVFFDLRGFRWQRYWYSYSRLTILPSQPLTFFCRAPRKLFSLTFRDSMGTFCANFRRTRDHFAAALTISGETGHIASPTSSGVPAQNRTMSKDTTPVSVLIVDDEAAYREMLAALLKPQGYRIHTASDGVEAINNLQKSFFDLVLLDVKLPRVDGVEVLRHIQDHYVDTQVIMLTGVGDLRIAVECMKLGAYHYLTKPYSSDELLELINRALERRRLIIENKVMKSELARIAVSSDFVGSSPALMKVLELAGKVAPTDSTVLIEGPSGTGKELLANFLYKNSLRSDKPFVALSCASIPDTLIESELFGHEKGAFTDAYAMRQGLVEIANGGTLFLDEIGEISPVFQPKLLRFIQTGEFRRVGGNKTMKSDVRIISATNRHLVDEVKEGRFREDLLYRINVITLSLPSLHERKDDILLLAEDIVAHKLKTRTPKKLHADTLPFLMEYPWPGNVRELENVLERAAILSSDEYIRPKDLALPRSGQSDLSVRGGEEVLGSAVTLKEVEQGHIAGVLKRSDWNKKLAAGILGISLKTLYTKIQQYNIVKK